MGQITRVLALMIVAGALAGCAEIPEAEGACNYLWSPGDAEAVLIALIGPNGRAVESFGVRLVGDNVSSETTTDAQGCAAFHVPRGGYEVLATGEPDCNCYYAFDPNQIELQINVAEYEIEVSEVYLEE